MTDIEERQKLAIKGKDYEYSKEAEEQLENARLAFIERREAEREREDLEKQVRLYRRALRYYRDQLTEANDIGNVLCSAIDTFTERHPEHAAEIKELIDYWESSPEDDDE